MKAIFPLPAGWTPQLPGNAAPHGPLGPQLPQREAAAPRAASSAEAPRAASSAEEPQPPPVPRNVSVPEALRMAGEHFQARRYGEVEAFCVKVLEVEPENPDALHLIGLTAHMNGRHAIALPFLEKAARLNPASAQYLYNLGVVQGMIRRPDLALLSYRAAVALDPLYPNAMGNLGNAAFEADLYEEAMAAYDQVLARNPQDANVFLARAICLFNMRRLDESRAAFAAAVQRDPGHVRAVWEQAHQLLLEGDYARGWEAYEARFANEVRSNVWRYPYPFPLWQGEPLAGKTLLVHGEQGLGDEIMFASIYGELIAQARQVIICCQPHLAPLFRASFPQARVEAQLRADADAWTRLPAGWLADAPPIDYQIPFASLGRLRRRALADFPAHAGYLRTDPAKVSAWAMQLPVRRTGELRVGLCWAANPALEESVAARRSRKKSLTLAQLEPLFEVPGVRFISLQTREAAAQIAASPPRVRERLIDASAGLNDFTDTAALIANLDLVLSVDTSVAHLAGALNRPVWIALPWQADWRWHHLGESTEWYPSARLFRQQALNEWDGTIARLRAALEARANAEAARASGADAARSPASDSAAPA
jgi:Flp pilus assembly protein TadD